MVRAFEENAAKDMTKDYGGMKTKRNTKTNMSLPQIENLYRFWN